MRPRKELRKNKDFVRMSRNAYFGYTGGLSFKRWMVKNWNDLLESWDLIK